MNRLPRRTSLVAQTVEVLREAVASGEWPRWMPGEIELTKKLRISRITLRAALAELEREKIIRAGQGRRREIVHGRSPRNAASTRRSVALISPEPLHRLAASTVFWIDELREHLDASGWPLEIHESAAAYSRRPTHALEELVCRVHPAGWVLYRSTPEMQRWFSEHTPSAVIAGSRHPEIHLSSVDVDHAAGCRHAAGRFLAEGHERLAIIRPESQLAGDLQSVAGFQQGARADVAQTTHNGSIRSICTSLDRLFSRAPRPTGLFVFHPTHLLTVLGWLQRRSFRVPHDVSVICRDDESFLDSVLPSPARYTLNATAFARKISRIVASLVTGASTRPQQYRILPTFVPGETLGKVPAKD
jgi:DNA-binding LacI/PurR family transcriptional regulator